MIKNCLIYILIFSPFILFSQQIDKEAIDVFINIDKGEYNIASESLHTLIENNPRPEFYLAKADILFKLSDYSQALKYCSKADKLKTNYSSKLKTKIYLELEEKENAKLAIIENSKSRNKIDLYDLLETEEYSLIYQLELDEFVLSGNLYSRTERQLYQVERLIQSEKYNQAHFIINEMLLRNNNIAQAHYLQSWIKYKENDLNGSLRSIDKAIDLKGSNESFLDQRVIICVELKNYSQALSDVNKLIRLNSYKIENYITKADLLLKAYQYEEAINLISSILEVLPNSPEVLYLSGKSYFIKEDYFEALAAINQSIEIEIDKDYYELRGDIYSAMNTFEFAIKDYSMYLDIEAYNGDIYAKKGYARLKYGDKKGACSDWEKGKRYGSYDAINYLDKYCR